MFYELSLASNHKDGLCVIKNGQSQVYNEADETLKTLRKQLLETQTWGNYDWFIKNFKLFVIDTD